MSTVYMQMQVVGSPTVVIFQLVNGGMDKYLAIDDQMTVDESDRLMIAIEPSEVLLVEDKRDRWKSSIVEM